MAQPTEKLKRIIWITGITGVVYAGFKYLLPLVVPFLFAWIAALLLEPSAKWLSRKCSICIRGKCFGLPVGVAGVMELLVILMVLLWGGYAGGQRLCEEACLLMERLPVWITHTDVWLTGTCHQLEEIFGLRENILVIYTRDMLRGFIIGCREKAMPYLMMNSVSLVRCFVQIMVISAIFMVAAALLLQELDRWRHRLQSSMFHEEFARMGKLLHVVADAYVKTQGIIMVLTASVCTVVFWAMGNPYYILAGVGIGLLDALPVFGTGTVLIPWAMLLFLRGSWGRGAVILALYMACYFLREILEAKLMSEKVGLSPVETLAAMYVGLQLFGLWGFLLGPVGLMMIREFSGIRGRNEL